MPFNIQSENSNSLLTKCGIFFKIFQAISRITQKRGSTSPAFRKPKHSPIKVVENRADRNPSACSCKS